MRAHEIIHKSMKCNPGQVGEWVMRRLFLCVLLLAVGCRAQNPSGAELNRKIEKQVRVTFGVPPYVDVNVGERTPSSDFAGYEHLLVNFSYQGQSQTRELLLSK